MTTSFSNGNPGGHFNPRTCMVVKWEAMGRFQARSTGGMPWAGTEHGWAAGGPYATGGILGGGGSSRSDLLE